MTRAIDAVIFDFDGVLVDSEPLHEWAIRASVRDRGWEFDTERFFRHIVGRGDENAYRRIAEWNNASVSDAEIRAFLERKWALMAEGIEAQKYSVQEGAAEAVRAAAELGPVAVCSGSVRSTVDTMLRKIGLRDALGALVCGDDVARMKPDPEGYLMAARLLGREPGRCLAVEDTPTGVLAAKRAGMYVVAVEHTVPGAMLAEADRVIGHIRELRIG
jgi:beta-phosphoglucomutase